jgi:hypothetical protein
VILFKFEALSGNRFALPSHIPALPMSRRDANAAWSPDISVFAESRRCCAVCAPRTLSRVEIELEIALRDPAGSRGIWAAGVGPFPDALPNPRPCQRDAHRQHWLLIRQDADPT